jgi:flavin reductase (DIM6/NTAB) family NADH-FMN oxidoreductase RutF
MKETGGGSQAISTQEFREALGFFATGIAVVTATMEGRARIGATVRSFNSVSLDPPLVLFSMARSSQAFPAWQSVPHFTVNVLAEHQDATSTNFARARSDKWVGARCVEGENGAPLLPDSLAPFECARYANYDGESVSRSSPRIVHRRLVLRPPDGRAPMLRGPFGY